MYFKIKIMWKVLWINIKLVAKNREKNKRILKAHYYVWFLKSTMERKKIIKNDYYFFFMIDCTMKNIKENQI